MKDEHRLLFQARKAAVKEYEMATDALDAAHDAWSLAMDKMKEASKALHQYEDANDIGWRSFYRQELEKAK